MTPRERAWWAGVLFWALVVFFWRPQPPVLYTEVPSVVPYPDGYRIFHDLVKRETRGVGRSLRKAGELDEDVDVLVLLSPTRGVDRDSRQQLLDWVLEGGTLVVGHPLWDSSGKNMESIIASDQYWSVASWSEQEPELATITTIPTSDPPLRHVPEFSQQLRGTLMLPQGEGHVLATSEDETTVATVEEVGAGRMIQIADARILNNEALGFKKAHLFAAALIDEAGREGKWAFDESHEGVSIQPTLAPLVGSGALRGLFLHSLLILLFWYWWRSSRLGQQREAPDNRRAREVTTMAQDVGSFYLRARRADWALSRYVDYFQRALNSERVTVSDKEKGMALVRRAEALLNEGKPGMDGPLHLLHEMAGYRRMLVQKEERIRK